MSTKPKERYAVTRWSAPGEWDIQRVPAGYDHHAGTPGEVFDTFSQAKAWLVDQTRAWVEGFRDDAVEIRAMRKCDVRDAGGPDLDAGYRKIGGQP